MAVDCVDGDSLSVGAIVGIVAAIIVIVLVLLALAFVFYRRRKSHQEDDFQCEFIVGICSMSMNLCSLC